MLRNNLYWLHQIREVFVPLIDAFSDCVKKRVLPSFDNLGREAEQVTNEAWNSLCRYATEDSDPGDFADTAFEKGLGFYQTMTGMGQGIRNLFAVGLYHLFEQQFLLFHRGELLQLHERENTSLYHRNEAKRRLASHGIDVERFRSCPELRS